MATKTIVVNKYYEAYDIYIGRGSKWGNPFIIGADGDRDEVVRKFEHYIKNTPHLLESLEELRGKRLGCFCKPKNCHGDILVRLLEEKDKNMNIEIERKFLLKDNSWRNEKLYASFNIQQGYIDNEGKTRIRICNNMSAEITIKGKQTGISRYEYSFEIPYEKGLDCIKSLCENRIIYKNRSIIKTGEVVWEIDEFYEENEGLILVEVELKTEEDPIILPKWLGEEVTYDKKYYNFELAKNPYSQWQKKIQT